MNIYSEIKKIAGYNHAINELVNKLKDKIDCEGLFFEQAKLISGCSIRSDGLYQNGELLSEGEAVNDDYFCNQSTGYCEDDYYGTVWFKTNVPGQFVEIPFAL